MAQFISFYTSVHIGCFDLLWIVTTMKLWPSLLKFIAKQCPAAGVHPGFIPFTPSIPKNLPLWTHVYVCVLCYSSPSSSRIGRHSYTRFPIIYASNLTWIAFSQILNISLTVVKFSWFARPWGLSQWVFLILSAEACSFISLRKYFT